MPLYKQIGYVLCCNYCRDIKLIEIGLKILENILKERPRNIAEVNKMQYEFMPRNSTVYAIFIVYQLIESTIEWNKDMYCWFVNFKGAYNRVPK